jgi:hypothetical protein
LAAGYGCADIVLVAELSMGDARRSVANRFSSRHKSAVR